MKDAIRPNLMQTLEVKYKTINALLLDYLNIVWHFISVFYMSVEIVISV